MPHGSRLPRLFREALEFAQIEQQQLVRIDSLALLAAKRLKQFEDRLLLLRDRFAERSRLLFGDFCAPLRVLCLPLCCINIAFRFNE